MSEQQDSKKDLSGPLSVAVLLLLFLVVVGWFLWWRLPTPKDVAAFGDAFGGVAGTLVSGFALVLLIFTVLQQQRALKLQREQLLLQRKELRETRAELGRAADAQAAQVETAKQTAKLNALSALLNSSLNSTQVVENMVFHKTNPVPIEERIKEILEALDVGEVDG